MTDKMSISPNEIENRIFTIRSTQVMIDSHLAEMYNVETKVFNQAVRRNIERFPASFRFQLTENEWSFLRSQIVTLEKGPGQHRKYLPFAFTEQGVAMLSAILRSETAIMVSIQIMNAFVEMRKLVLKNADLFHRLDKLELKQIETDQKFEHIFKALESRDQTPNKRMEAVKATIYTKQINKQLHLDIKKHNEQYPAVEIKIFADSHDRFLIIDERELYHIGASLKDLGKKWFAISKMDSLTIEVLNKLKATENITKQVN